MPDSSLYQILLLTALIYAVGGFIVTQFIMNAPYGQHDNWSKNTLRIPQKYAWIIMESPAAIIFTVCLFMQGVPSSVTPWLLFSMWAVHYFHRAFIYPFSLRGDIRIPWIIVLSGGFYCALNGYLNGMWVGVYAEYTNKWLTDPRFIIGCLLYLFGYFLNKHSDYTLANLRKPGESDFKIPYGGGFNYVSAPHYLGEIVTWMGFAIACWSVAGLLFLIMTMANLIPRALTTHHWYHENFTNYPKNRKAIIPFIL